MIPFNKPPFVGVESKYVEEAIHSSKISGGGKFTIECEQWFQDYLKCSKALMTPSCTHALEMTAILLDLKIGDEVIMPSYTFVSTANAFLLRGAKIVFVDIRPDTLNIDETKIEEAITSRTKAIVPVHYAGVACEMDSILKIAEKHNLYVVEDAAQGIFSRYKGKLLGTLGALGTYSFHETKNYTSGGEGGLLIVNDKKFVERAEIIREKGTNRSRFFRGQVDKYTWVDVGSSYLASELQAAYLWGQLENAKLIFEQRMRIWKTYYERLALLYEEELIELPHIPEGCDHNAHMFYIKLKNELVRDSLISYLKGKGIIAVFHYVPLHSSSFGAENTIFSGQDIYTTKESTRLIRLPMYHGLSNNEQETVIDAIYSFFRSHH
ncbi:MAG: dTDP-4-amino-4,6-dideoxygalactose transaminase [Pseudohongiellaceae bacterium]|nr:dTDP-4-amino-4,6-dideoxygalactose transaminase [Pseudohongiellaceae bacterium]